jgi:hypothetical protein
MSNNKKTLLSESQIRQFMKLAKLEPLTPGFVSGLTAEGTKKGQPSKAGGKAWESPTKGQKITQGPHKGEEAYKGPSKGELDKPEEGPKAKSPGYRPKAYGQPSSTNEGEEDEIEESHGRGRGEGAAGLGNPDQNTRNESVYRDEDEELEAELGAEDEWADEEADDIDDLEGDLDVPDEAEGPADQLVSVDDFLDALGDALRSAVSEVTGEETEVDVVDDEEGAPEDEEIEVGAEAELEVPGGELEMGAEEEELMEGLLDAAGVELVDTSALVEKITKRVAARIVKEALKAKK